MDNALNDTVHIVINLQVKERWRHPPLLYCLLWKGQAGSDGSLYGGLCTYVNVPIIVL